MSFFTIALMALAIVSVSACSGPLPQTSRNETGFFDQPMALSSPRERAVTEQAIALEDSIRAILAEAEAPARTCDAANLADPTMALCTEQDLLGRTMGALKSFAGQPVPLDRNALAPAITLARDELSTLDSSIVDLLRAQAQEQALLNKDVQTGFATENDRAARLSHMAQSRNAIDEALGLSLARAQETRRALESAQARGEGDYSWYIQSMREIESRTSATRRRLGLG